MRRGLVAVIVSFALVIVVAWPAFAASKPPTAIQQVRKLVQAGVCTEPQPVNATGTVAECTGAIYAYKGTIEVHAFKKRAAMLRDLDRGIEDACTNQDKAFGVGASRDYRPQFRVGPTWWTHPYRDLENEKIGFALGGTMKQYSCS